MNRRLFLILFVVLLVLAGIYALLFSIGNNTPIQLSLQAGSPEPLSGIYYRGTPQNPKLKEVFERIEQEKRRIPGTYLHTIYEVEPAGKLDTLRVFVGLNTLLQGADISHRVFEGKGYVLAKIHANKWMMPGPERVKKRILEFADSTGIEISDIFIDKIVSENEIHVMAPGKPSGK